MILRTHYLRLTETSRSQRARERIAKALREGYAALPRVRGTEVGLAHDAAASKGWDVCVHLRFDDEGGIAAFETDPARQALEDEVLGGAVDFVKVWAWELA